jgi:hypothetical protein
MNWRTRDADWTTSQSSEPIHYPGFPVPEVPGFEITRVVCFDATTQPDALGSTAARTSPRSP